MSFKEIIPTATQAQAEAGTDTDRCIFTPQRIAQAIAALESGGGGGSSGYPPGYISPSLVIANGTDTDHDLDIAAGSARNSDNDTNIDLASAITKAMDSSWVVGDTNGGMQSGSSLPTSGTVNIYLIRRSDTEVVDVMGVPQGTAISLPTGYDSYAHIASLTTDSSGNFNQMSAFRRVGSGYEVEYKGLIPDLNVEDQGTTATARTLSVPVGRKIKAFINLDYVSIHARVYGGDQDESTVNWSSAVATTETSSSSSANSSTRHIGLWTNTSAQIYTDGASTNRYIKGKTTGYYDPLV